MTSPPPPDLRPSAGETRPLISVVLIFHDRASMLAEAIDSVLRQTMEDWELLLVDDGSTDGSATIAAGYAERDARVRCLAHPGRRNWGISATRNLGARQARGDFLTFIDSDDVWLASKLEEQVHLFTQHPQIDAVLGALEYWYSWDPAATERNRIVLTGDVSDRIIEPPEALLSFYPLGSAPGGGVDIMIRRSTFDSLGGFDDNFPGMYDDQILLSKLYLRHTIYVSSRPWLKYRQHAGSCTAQSPFGSRAYHAHRSAFLHWLSAYLKTRSDPHPAVVAALQAARRAQRLASLRAWFGSVLTRVSRRLQR